MASAATVTATIETWNSASLSGDVTPSMAVHFTSSAKSGSKITADHSARFSLTGMPKCTVSAITLYVRSNTSAGAAIIMLSVAGRTWLVASGNYSQWPGMSDYSTVAQPLQCLSDSLMLSKGDSLTVLVEGSVNSVYIDQVEVTYQLAPPEAYTVTLQWMSQQGLQQQSIAEAQAGEGIELPPVSVQDSVLAIGNDTWYWLGWSETNINTQSSSPIYWESNDWYGPEDHCTLYALYTNSMQQTMKRDSSFMSGEYALVRVEETDNPVMFALAGDWKSGKITVQTIHLEQDAQGEWLWHLNQLDQSLRYQLTFDQDSVAIYYPSSQSTIGYATTYGCNCHTKWAWKKSYNGTLFLYGAHVQDNFSNLSFTINQQDQCSAVYAQEPYFTDYPYWRLFPTASVPIADDVVYTTFSDVSGQSVLYQDNHSSSQCRKILQPNGRIIIQYQSINYNLLGQPL